MIMSFFLRHVSVQALDAETIDEASCQCGSAPTFLSAFHNIRGLM